MAAGGWQRKGSGGSGQGTECLAEGALCRGTRQGSIGGASHGMYLSLDVCGSVLRLHPFEYYGSENNLDCSSVVAEPLSGWPEALS